MMKLNLQGQRKADGQTFEVQKGRLEQNFIIGVTILIAFVLFYAQFSKSLQFIQQKERLLTQQTDQTIQYISYILDFVSSLANILKIFFQLTALLFIITDLVNFWNLASIYIFLPVQIPPFAKNILLNVWIEFNQPILSFFNVEFNAITFKQRQSAYPTEEQYKSALELDVSQIAFEPLIVFCATAVQLIVLTMILRWIKRSFKKIREKVNQGIDIDHAYSILKAKQNQFKSSKANGFNFFLKSNKIQPLSDSLVPKKEPLSIPMQESIKNIFDSDSSQLVTEELSNAHKPKMTATLEGQVKNQSFQAQTHPQLKFMLIIHKLAQSKLAQTSKQKSKRHWSQTISIDQFQILSALMISFMPVLLLPFYDTICKMKYESLKGKLNLVIYFFILAVIFIYPFIYLTAKLSSSKKITSLKKKDSNGSQENEKKKCMKMGKKSIRQSLSLAQLPIQEQTFETFFLFFMNMTIPICVGITSSPLFFLSINTLMHILLVMSSINLFSKRSCSSKIKKWNKTIQQFTFLLYHACFFGLYLFNQMKESWLSSGFMEKETVDQIFGIFGMMIICIFAVGGLHQMVEFLLKISCDVFKIIYMIFLVIAGGYDTKQLQDQMKRLVSKDATLKNDCPMKLDKKEQIHNKQADKYPKGTMRSLDELSVDFDIQIVKNQIILNKMKLLRMKQSNQQDDQVSQINLAEINLEAECSISKNVSSDLGLNQALENKAKGQLQPKQIHGLTYTPDSFKQKQTLLKFNKPPRKVKRSLKNDQTNIKMIPMPH